MTDNQQDSVAADQRPSMAKKRSSLFSRARQSFYRSGGKKGASVETLRGNKGADFEGHARVKRGKTRGLGCSCFGGKEEKDRFILIKGHFCFVFSDEDAKSPKYAIDLTHRKASIQEASRDGKTVVLLETGLGDVDYEFVFDTKQDKNIAKKFSSAVGEEAARAEAELVKKRLGHEHLMKTRPSVRYAEKIGEKKVESQPDAPVTAAEIADASPLPMNAI